LKINLQREHFLVYYAKKGIFYPPARPRYFIIHVLLFLLTAIFLLWLTTIFGLVFIEIGLSAHIVFLILIFSLIGSEEKESDKEEIETPYYEIVEEKDLSYSNVVRWQVKAKTYANVTREEVELIAKDIVKYVKSKMEVNAIAIFLYRFEDDISGLYTIASIDYAPYGDWSRADEVETGDYSKHRYHIEYA